MPGRGRQKASGPVARSEHGFGAEIWIGGIREVDGGVDVAERGVDVFALGKRTAKGTDVKNVSQ